MGREHDVGQLELFDLANQAMPRPHRDAWGRMLLQVRYDQLVVTSVVALLGLTVVFASGVERGKQLARAERALLARQQPAQPYTPTTTDAESAATAESRPASSVEILKEDQPRRSPTTVRKKEPTRVVSSTPVRAVRASVPAAAGTSRYAVQVVTYTQVHLAKRELDRLQARGERAFLVMRNDRTVVYVGPFPSKVTAAEKLTMLKSRYQDCFVRVL